MPLTCAYAVDQDLMCPSAAEVRSDPDRDRRSALRWLSDGSAQRMALDDGQHEKRLRGWLDDGAGILLNQRRGLESDATAGALYTHTTERLDVTVGNVREPAP